MALCKRNAIIGYHNKTNCRFIFRQFVNPKDHNDFYFRCERSLFNGKARSLEYIKENFNNLTIDLWSE